jgi:hypothetical protein
VPGARAAANTTEIAHILGCASWLNEAAAPFTALRYFPSTALAMPATASRVRG